MTVQTWRGIMSVAAAASRALTWVAAGVLVVDGVVDGRWWLLAVAGVFYALLELD